MTTTRFVVAVVLFVLACGGQSVGVANARPLDVSRLPSAAEGVGHIDVDALRVTQMFAEVRKLAGEAKLSSVPEPLQPLATYLLSGTRGVSFWLGANDTGAVLIEVTDGKKVRAMLDKVPSVGTLTLAGTQVRRYDFGPRPGKNGLLAQVGNVFVLSDDERSMSRSLEALAGKKQPPRNKLFAGARDAGVFFFATLDDKRLDQVKQVASSAMLKADLTALSIRLGEVGAVVQARLSAHAKTAESAEQVKGVLEGLRALVGLTNDNKSIKSLLEKVKVTVVASRVDVAIDVPARDVIALIQAAR